VIARSNTHEDIKRGGIPGSAAAGYSGAVQAADAAVGAVQELGDLEKALGSIVAKLDVFVQIMDKTSRVCGRRFHEAIPDDRPQVHPSANFAWRLTLSLYKKFSEIEFV